MLTSKSNIEWHLANDEDEWQDLRGLYSFQNQETTQSTTIWQKNRAVLILLGIILIGFGLKEAYSWQKAQTRQALHVGEIHAVVERENSTRLNADKVSVQGMDDDASNEYWERMLDQEQVPQRVVNSSLPAYIEYVNPESKATDWGAYYLYHDLGWKEPSPKQPSWKTSVQKMEFREDQALVEMLLHGTDTARSPQTFRMTRFYHQTGDGWTQTVPVTDFWGASQTLETTHIAFHFRERDAEAVAAVADRIESLYIQMRTSVGLSDSQLSEELIIEVSVADLPENRFHLPISDVPLTILSPDLATIPAELTDADVLYQAVAIQLAQQTANQLARTKFKLKTSERILWGPVLNGLRLWLIWNAEGEFATQKANIVEWILRDPAGISHMSGPHLPDAYQQICQQFEMWHLSPAAVNIPLVCSGVEQAEYYRPRPNLRMRQLGGPVFSIYDPSYQSRSDIGASAAMATLYDYIVEEYGEEQMPILLSEVGNHLSWGTLIFQVFDVSIQDFESGWWAYLNETYGVTLP